MRNAVCGRTEGHDRSDFTVLIFILCQCLVFFSLKDVLLDCVDLYTVSVSSDL